jgi:hypothetical protein
VGAFYLHSISDNGTVTITGYTGLGGAVIIPNMINVYGGYPVTSIANECVR